MTDVHETDSDSRADAIGSTSATDGQSGNEFGRQLKLCRKAKGMSLKQLSDVVHLHPSTLSRMENGTRGPSLENAWLCDDALRAGGALVALVPAQCSRRGKPAGTDGHLLVRALSVGGHPAPSGYGADYDALLARGDALRAVGKMHAAQQSYQAAFDIAQGVPRAQAETVIRISRRWSDPGQQDLDAIARIRSALESLSGDDSRVAALLRLRLRAHLAKKLSFAVSQDVTASRSVLDDGTALARQTLGEIPADAPDEVRCEVLVECRWGLFDSAAPAELASLSGQAQGIALRTGSAHFVGESLAALAIDQMRTGQVRAAQATIQGYRRRAEFAGSALARWHQGVFDTLLDLWRGNFAAAEDRLFGQTRETVEASEAELEISADTLGQTYQGQSYWLLREQGRIAEMLRSPMLARMEDHEFAPIWRAGFTLARCETKNWILAADQLQEFAQETGQFRSLPRNGWAVPTLMLFAEACSLLHAHADYRDLAADFAPAIDARLRGHESEIALAGWPTVLIGPVARARGLLAFVADDTATALDLLAVAERLARSSPPHMARLRADRARVLLARAGRKAGTVPPEVPRLLNDSQKAAESLGMARLAADIRALRADANEPN